MKNILKFLACTCLAAAPISASAEEITTISYCGEEVGYTMGALGSGAKLFSAIKVPASKAAELSGNSLTEVMMVGYQTGKVSNTQIFLSYDLTGEPFYTQAFTPRANEAWTTVYLNTPYAIDGKEFYIGYYCETANTNAGEEALVLPFDGGVTVTDGDFVGEIHDNAPTEVLHASEIEANAGNALIRGVVRGDNLQQDNVTALNLITVERARPGVPFHAYLKVKNSGVGTLSKFNVDIDCGDGETMTVPVACKLGTDKEGTFTLSDIKFSTVGNKTLKITINKPNGSETAAPSNISAEIKCEDGLFPRKVLLEHFSTAQCSNCPNADNILEGILDGREDIIPVAHHAGFGTDAMTCNMATQYLWFYNSSTFAPAMMLDRVNLGNKGAESIVMPVPGPVFTFGSYNLMEQLVNLRADEPAPLSVNVSGEYNPDTRLLNVSVNGEVGNTLEQELYLHVFLLEDELYGMQAGAGGGYRWDDVSRTSLTPVWGEQISIADGKYENTYSTTLKENWNSDNLHIVAFVSDMNRDNPNACEVHNANGAALTLSSIKNATAGRVSINPVSGGISVSGDAICTEVWSVTGSKAAILLGEGTATLPQGVYVVRVKTSDGIQTAKVIVIS